ncbi:dna repair protein pso2 [Moniliophthora roreri MCA 2997]|uniref:Dna repair protein pso2 n=2 Tax=Moniliophthora roreri TaxID=221103 RepID=V2XVU1_MONRO|nr:dna repair protein pso2 [Moniliophthora roreri MCA 2997]KAI3602591.1 dna repair protein pso2 [Moniliophthora roreri]
MAKKSKPTSTQSTTLHNYFGTAASASTPTPKKTTPRDSSKPKPQTKSVPAPKRRKPANSTPPNPEDVIVISSEDELDMIGPGPVVKKLRVESKIVESVAGRSSGTRSDMAQEKENNMEIDEPGDVTKGFGRPDESLLSSAPTKTASLPALPSSTTQSTSFSFGRPSSLLQDTSNTEAGPSTLVRECSKIDLPKEADDWTMDDDEARPEPEPSDDDEVEFVEMDVNQVKGEDLTSAGPSNSHSHTPKPLIPPDDKPPPPPGAQNSNVYSVLMSSHKENEAWREAENAEDRSFRPNQTNGNRRKAPFYKIMQGMPIAVDAFKYGSIPGVTAYFLTHAHSDHYTNLSSSWNNGPIYCSHGTANLIKHMLRVPAEYVFPLPMDTLTLVPNSGGVHVTLIEANHCPGSCLFLFEGKQTVDAGDSKWKSNWVGKDRVWRYLHCGDFRASPEHVLHPAVKGKRLDVVYLDTTYLDPRYTFPPQPLVISACADLAGRIQNGNSKDDGRSGLLGSFFGTKPRDTGKAKEKETVLLVVGTYSIGKERIVKAIAKATNSKIYCDTRKAAILHCENDPELEGMLTTNPKDASVHLVPLGVIVSDKLREYLDRWKGHFTRVVGFRPTGWTYTAPAGTDTLPSIPSVITKAQKTNYTYVDLQPSRQSTKEVEVYPVPYSEHSSFFELTCFAMSVEWGRIIATVNVGSEKSRGKMDVWVKRWEGERRKEVTKDEGYVVPYRRRDYW